MPGPELVIFTRAGDAYEMTHGPDQPNEPAVLARTLHAGSGRLLMLRSFATGEVPTIQGWFVRNQLEDDRLREFSPAPERIEALLKSRYSAASSIALNHGVLVVKRFDEDAYRLLSEVAGDSSGTGF